jgi:hypothetical protein
VGIREKHAPCRESVDVWRSCLRVTAKTADPIVQIIDSDEQDVWTVCSHGAFGHKNEQSNQAEDRFHVSLRWRAKNIRFGCAAGAASAAEVKQRKPIDSNVGSATSTPVPQGIGGD